MIDPELLERHLAERFGGETPPILRDPAHPGGLREWNREDTLELCRWLESQEPPAGNDRICLNLQETADALGVAAQTVQRWMRRPERPIPHLKEGRRLLVPRALLVKWVEAEAGRNGGRNPGES